MRLTAFLLMICALVAHAVAQPALDVTIRNLPGPATAVATLEPFEVLAPDVRVLIGRRDGDDLPLAARPSVRLWRGTLRDRPGTHVLLIAGDETRGLLDLGPGRGRFLLRDDGDGLAARPLAIERIDLPVGLCGVSAVDIAASGAGPAMLVAPPLRPDTRRLRLAIETDYELFSLFGDAEAELDYLVALYGAISDIFIRDVNTRIEITYIRLWTDENDRFNQPDPLNRFRTWWNANQQDVPRDLAQFCSGRRDLPYGGVAYLSAICEASGYSVTGYNLGFLDDPQQVHAYNRDIIINAHELGHNFAARHAHDYGYDDCGSDMGAPQRGTIMSYCGQTRSGGDGNIDLRFDARIARVMRNYVRTTCLPPDCNGNGSADADDLDGADTNDNGVPDECEDCNGNGVLDPNDIAAATSSDLDGDGVPDECQPDCNENGVPDAFEVAEGLATDADFNAVPDACQVDCDDDGLADIVEIEQDMDLDVNRDALLDACADCDGDGLTDEEELAGAYNVWVGVHEDPTLYQFHARSGVKLGRSAGTSLGHVNDVRITSDGRVLVSDGPNARVAEFAADGTFVRDLVAPGAGGLQDPKAMVQVADGSLVVVDGAAPAVRRYDVASGAYLGDLVDPAALSEPFGVAVSPRATLCVSERDGRVLEFDPVGGMLLRELVTVDDNGGLTNPHGLLFTPAGRLLVCSRGSNQVLAYDGQTGDFEGQFNVGGTSTRLTLDKPFCIRLGPDNDIYVSRHAGHDHGGLPGPNLHLTDARIFHFDLESGVFVRAFVVGNDNNIGPASGFDFRPGRATDCNFNQVPDACELADGTSSDLDGNGRPDECDCLGDTDGDVDTDLTDLAVLLANFGLSPADRADGDLNADGAVTLGDLSLLLGAFGEGCLVPLP